VTDEETPATLPFRMVGDAGLAACTGDGCELPAPASVDIEDLNP
jgi:hypothetical protein